MGEGRKHKLVQQRLGLQMQIAAAQSDKELLQNRNAEFHQRQEDLQQLYQHEGLRQQLEVLQQEHREWEEEYDEFDREMWEQHPEMEVDREEEVNQEKETVEKEKQAMLETRRAVKMEEEAINNKEEDLEKKEEAVQAQHDDAERRMTFEIRGLELRLKVLKQETEVLEVRNKALEDENVALDQQIENRRYARESQSENDAETQTTDDAAQGDPSGPKDWEKSESEQPKESDWLDAKRAPLPPSAVSRQPCEICDFRRKYRREGIANKLRQDSGMDDDSFFKTPASYCYIPFHRQLELMREALRLAKVALWEAMREHWREECSRLWFESPEEVLFGNDELDQSFESVKSLLFHKGGCFPEFDAKVVTGLRNAVSHPVHRNTFLVDKEIKRALELALEIQDRDRVMKIKHVREDLQAEAISTQSIIEAQVHESGEVGRRDEWPLHIERFFRDTQKLSPEFQSSQPRYIYGNVNEKVRQVFRAYRGCTTDNDVPEGEVAW